MKWNLFTMQRETESAVQLAIEKQQAHPMISASWYQKNVAGGRLSFAHHLMQQADTGQKRRAAILQSRESLLCWYFKTIQ
ncbi:hypothetical protein [Paenibacillus massiliensis]|uniref:hypothetical protein n=1 Tax=Paenibacillus massiliensis TaxID=225917 RepID=UPI000375B077|nr:hypothetical protein [Paenibacillus massiliensis]